MKIKSCSPIARRLAGLAMCTVLTSGLTAQSTGSAGNLSTVPTTSISAPADTMSKSNIKSQRKQQKRVEASARASAKAAKAAAKSKEANDKALQAQEKAGQVTQTPGTATPLPAAPAADTTTPPQ